MAAVTSFHDMNLRLNRLYLHNGTNCSNGTDNKYAERCMLYYVMYQPGLERLLVDEF